MKYQGIIYRAYCFNTKKSYIGQTINGLNQRKQEHFTSTFGKTNSQTHFHKAIRKYGIDNFEWTIIDTINAESLESLRDCLDVLEIKYIKQFDSYCNGYNMTTGGQGGATLESKKVTIYNQEGQVIKYCLSVKDAAEYLEIPVATVQASVIKKQNFVYMNRIRYIIRYSDEVLTQQEIDYIKQLTYNTPVYMFDQSGNIIQEFETAKQASKILKINYTIVCNCCNRIQSSTTINNKLYTFRRYNILTEEDIQSLKKQFKHKKKIKAYDYSTNKLLKTYNSITEASKELNIPYSTLNKCVNGGYKYLIVNDAKIKFKEFYG